jgi:hypothetical protein
MDAGHVRQMYNRNQMKCQSDIRKTKNKKNKKGAG